MSNANDNLDSADYFSYQERVLLSPPSSLPEEPDVSRRRGTSSSNSPWQVRLESLSQWSNDTWAHPFAQELQGILQLFPQVTRILIQSSSAPSNSYSSTSTAAAAVLDTIPALGSNRHSHSQPPSYRGPAGVWIRVHVQGETFPNSSNNNNNKNQQQVELITTVLSELAERRLVVAPVTSAKTYDIFEDDNDDDDHTGNWIFQIMLPTDGSSFSADALEQSFSAWTPCRKHNTKTSVDGGGVGGGMLSHATALSNVLLGNMGGGTFATTSLGCCTNHRRSTWLDLTSTLSSASSSSPSRSSRSSRRRYQWTVSQGVQYSIPHTHQTKLESWSQWILPGATVSSTSCPLADQPLAVEVVVRTMSQEQEEGGYQLVPLAEAKNREDKSSTTNIRYHLPWFSLSKVVRRPHGMANRGRLETVIVNDHVDCVAQVEWRDVIPSFVTPQWRTLRAYSVAHYEDGDPGSDDTHKRATTSILPHVEWRTTPAPSGGTNPPPLLDAVLRISTQLPPHTSLFVTLDYDPAFLSFEDFPGDPNRGMELAPATATLTCLNNHNHSSHSSFHLYSNTILILPPVPDMSMPFNVTSLTCSLYAYVVGTIVALVVKKASERMRYKLHPEERPKSKLVLLKERMRSKLTVLQGKLSKSHSNEKENDPQQDPLTVQPVDTSTGEEEKETTLSHETGPVGTSSAL
jgi:hypothetical protein